MSLPKYESYKDSGVEWLGEVPKHWGVMPLKRLAKLITGITPNTEEYDNYSDDSIHPWIRPENIDELGKETKASKFLSYEGWSKIRPIEANSSLICCIGTIGKVGYVQSEVSTNQQITAASFISMPRYFFYSLISARSVLEYYSTGNVLRILNSERLGNINFPHPPNLEGNLISRFLDQETAKIDNLIAEQQQLIELLKEKRQAVISHAVTKGLNPDVPMKDSGVEWLGEVPEHWEVLATKRLFKLVCVPAPKSHDYELLSIYTAIGVRPRKELEQKGNKATSTDGYWMVNKGDLIVNKLLAWMGAIGISEYDGVTSPAYDILRQRLSLQPKYYDFLFRCGICFSEFRRYSRGIMDMRLRLYFDEFGRLFMPYPPVDEQKLIINFLEYELNKFDILILESSKVISLLKERRSALISSAVTGKIDVQNFVSTQSQVEALA